MLRTNSKLVKDYFDSHLHNILENNFDGKIEEMAEQFYRSTCNSKGGLYSAYKTYQEAFKEVSNYYGECWYDDMRNVLREALQQTEQEANKYSNKQVSDTYNRLLYTAYLRKCEKENVVAHLHKI